MTAPSAFVLDASLTLAWILPDEATRYGHAMLHLAASSKVWFPRLWTHEVGNGLLTAQRRRRLTPAQRAAFVEELLRLPIELDDRPPRGVLETHVALAEQYGLTAYDAAYLDLALRKGIPLMTQDKTMRAAAAHAGVRTAAA